MINDTGIRLKVILSILAFGLMVSALPVEGQDTPPPPEAKSEGSSKYWVSGQFNVVGQLYPSFHSDYSGPLSFEASGQAKPTWVATVYTGYALFQHTELIFDVESSKGTGVSGALGLGGLGNLDAVTDPGATAKPYIARAHVRQIIPLGKHMVDADRNPLSLASTLPERRLELRVGKMSLTDFFDLNSVGSDSHLQFLNYAIDNNASYDVPANSRGYTYAVLAELYEPLWTLRFAEAFEPKDSSGQQIQWNLSRGSSENLEVEIHPTIKGKQPFTIRALGFRNHAQMGSYPAAISAFLSGQDTRPELSAHIGLSHSYGFGVNGESAALPAGVRIFWRLGWNAGTKEIFQFAEADRTLAFGSDFDGRAWKRKKDRTGIATAISGLESSHRQYLALGGQSYLLGDGGLSYGTEKVLEGYYNVPVGHGIFAAFDVQRIWNPGYNQARGPVIIFGLRLHLEGDIHFN